MKIHKALGAIKGWPESTYHEMYIHTEYHQYETDRDRARNSAIQQAQNADIDVTKLVEISRTEVQKVVAKFLKEHGLTDVLSQWDCTLITELSAAICTADCIKEKGVGDE